MNLTYHHCRRIFKNFYSRLTATLLSFSPLHNSTDGFSRLSLYAFLHMSTFFFCCQHRSLWTKLGILWKVFNWKRQSFDSFRNQPEYSGENVQQATRASPSHRLEPLIWSKYLHFFLYFFTIQIKKTTTLVYSFRRNSFRVAVHFRTFIHCVTMRIFSLHCHCVSIATWLMNTPLAVRHRS